MAETKGSSNALRQLMRMDPEKREAYIDSALQAERKAKDLSALQEEPGWGHLQEEVKNRVNSLKDGQTMAIFSSGVIEPDKIHYARGFIAGMKFIVALAEGASQKWETQKEAIDQYYTMKGS